MGKRLVGGCCCVLALAPFVLTSCGELPFEDPVSRHEAAQRCSGQWDKQITNDYFGAHEENPWYTWEVHHAAAAEMVYSDPGTPSKERFAVAWVRRSDKKIYFRRYDTYTKSFSAGEQLLSNWTSPVGWIHTLGFDDDCKVISGQSTCAWFTWEDYAGDVDRAAVAPNGVKYVSSSYFDGYAPSGDIGRKYLGWGVWVRKRLLAYISRGGTMDRRQVRYKLLDHANDTEIKDGLLHTTAADFRAYQTAVAWSSVERRWLVAWAENHHPFLEPGYVGKVQARFVDFDTGDPDPQFPAETIIDACDGGAGLTPLAQLGTAAAPSGDVQPRDNPYGVCRSIWLASSYYSTLKDEYGVVRDRYRLHQYGIEARINGNGKLVSKYGLTPFCLTWCPITEAGFYYSGSLTPFQILVNASQRTDHLRLREDSWVSYNAGQVTASPYSLPQAFRSDGSVAVAVATNGTPLDPSSGLRLTIVDVRRDGCPP
jgi:hypothetical protein